jgi:hypothetical protein
MAENCLKNMTVKNNGAIGENGVASQRRGGCGGENRKM